MTERQTQSSTAGRASSAALDPLDPDVAIADLLSVRISRLARSIDRQSRRILGTEFGISLEQWRCLALLCERGPMKGMTLSEINDVDASLTSRALRGMAELGLVSWEGGTRRRSSGAAFATEKGKAFFHQVVPMMRARHRWLTAALDGAELREFYAMCDRLAARMEEGWSLPVDTDRDDRS
ncbi:MAG: winged helix-turn-helix transcriptional regulator [Rhodobacteraceae bacterium]|nr:winged helix-turn-helix transcriptional regulator [Paracoccaceae bacterium]